jgi:C4-dicarboxylate-specific signal transduction histidine kinase
MELGTAHDSSRPFRTCWETLDPNLVQLGVHNYGTIPPEHRTHLFQPFVSHGKDVTRKGLGLGLFIVSQIARAHRGEVAVSTSASDGTTFTVTIPRHCSSSTLAAQIP